MRLAGKPPASSEHATGLAKKRRPSRDMAETALQQPRGAIKKRLTKAEQKRFKRFQKGARKAGLLVSRNTYELYFRDHFTE